MFEIGLRLIFRDPTSDALSAYSYSRHAACQVSITGNLEPAAVLTWLVRSVL